MASHRKPLIPLAISGLLTLLPAVPLQAQPAPAETPAPSPQATPLSDKDRLALLGKITESRGYILMCADGALIPFENIEKWSAAATTPAERESRGKLISSVGLHADLIAALMMVTDPEIRQATRISREYLYQSIITGATACGIKLTREDIAQAPSAETYLSGIETTARKEIHRLVTEANAPQETFDQLTSFIIRGIHARVLVPEMRHLYEKLEK